MTAAASARRWRRDAKATSRAAGLPARRAGGAEERWREPAIRRAATLWAEARFYCVGQKGTVALVDAGPDGGTVVGQFEIPDAGPKTWAYPALADGRLYVRRKDHVYVYDVSRKE